VLLYVMWISSLTLLLGAEINKILPRGEAAALADGRRASACKRTACARGAFGAA